ncbi:MAG: hypothetical protein LBM70_03400 [Victivallales bacterium]|jgi:hypothetical protein|nr:hypothetical protein [Victivallales bacterium]
MCQNQISLDAVLTESWAKMRQLLFKPFRFNYWLILGFCAWMTILASEMGNVYSHIFRYTTNSTIKTDVIIPSTQPAGTPVGQQLWQEITRGITMNMLYFGVLMAIVVIISLILYYFRCRFEFIFLANLMRNTDEIAKPWREFKKQGNSYFWWTLLIGLIMLSVNLAFAFGTIFNVAPWLLEIVKNRNFTLPGSVFWAWVGAWIIVALIMSYYFLFLYQLLIPIMYRDNLTFKAGLRVMNKLIFERFGICFLYYLVLMIVLFAWGLVFVAAICVTCGLFLVLMMLPYVNAVVLLPFFVFYRLIGVNFLEKLDPRMPPTGEEHASTESL